MAVEGGGDFEVRRTENVSTSHYFRYKQEFNFSNNPTFVSGSDNSFVESSFEETYFITTVGLYSDSNELLSKGKTSQPITII